ncbi:GCG_CRPN prefix-to-repeats domain-containing protein [Methylobacterium oryzihabitans]
MMHKLIAAATLAAGLGLASTAGATPLAVPGAGAVAPDAPVTRVAGGCGPGFFRTPRGFCRPFRAYGPPRVYGRRCFVRPTPYGPRRFCRF